MIFDIASIIPTSSFKLIQCTHTHTLSLARRSFVECLYAWEIASHHIQRSCLHYTTQWVWLSIYRSLARLLLGTMWKVKFVLQISTAFFPPCVRSLFIYLCWTWSDVCSMHRYFPIVNRKRLHCKSDAVGRTIISLFFHSFWPIEAYLVQLKRVVTVHG